MPFKCLRRVVFISEPVDLFNMWKHWLWKICRVACFQVSWEIIFIVKIEQVLCSLSGLMQRDMKKASLVQKICSLYTSSSLVHCLLPKDNLFKNIIALGAQKVIYRDFISHLSSNCVVAC